MNKKDKLTYKQLQVLKYIYKYIQTDNISPTIREVADHFELSIGTVQDHIRALVKKGYVSISKNKSRGISLVRERLFKVPVLGAVQAGRPIFAVEDLEGYLDLDEMIFPEEGVFALRVQGDSMVGKGIFQDDFILMKKQEFAESGDIIVALIGEDVTVKTLKKRDGNYFLEPANKSYQSIPINEEVSIVGKVMKVIRNYG